MPPSETVDASRNDVEGDAAADLQNVTLNDGSGATARAATGNNNIHSGDNYGTGLDEVSITQANYRFAFCAAINSCNLGYDIGVSTQAGRLIQKTMGLSLSQREILVGSINFWSIFGAIGSQYFSDRYGRRLTFIFAAVGFIFGVILMASAANYFTLMFGRVFVGLGVGTGLAIDPLYIAEITPAKHRGELVTWSEIATNVGIVLGFATGLIFMDVEDGTEWRLMLGLGALLPIIMIILALGVMPESPRWLVAKGNDHEAQKVLRMIYPEGYNVDDVIKDIKVSIEREEVAEKAVGWDVIFAPTPAFHRMLLVGIGVAVAQQAVGIDAIQYYLLDVIAASSVGDAQVKQNLILILLGLVKLGFIVLGGKLFDFQGRRPVLFISLNGMAVALLILAFAFVITSTPSSGFVVMGLAIYMAFFSIGMGPGAWLIPSEIFATSIRAKAMSLATCSNRVVATIMSSTFLSTANAMGWGPFFLMLSIICMIVLAFLHMYLPETKGRSLEEMSMYFAELTNDRSILEAETTVGGRHDVAISETEMTSTSAKTTNGNGAPSSPSATQSEII